MSRPWALSCFSSSSSSPRWPSTFTNGFHDTANAMATSIATGALRPRIAVGLAAVMNLIGAFLSIKVATTIATGIVDAQALTLTIVFAA